MSTNSYYNGLKVIFWFIVIFFIGWFLGIVAGICANKLGHLLNLNPTLISTLSILLITLVRFSVWIPVFKISFHQSLLKTCFPANTNWVKNIIIGITITFSSLLVVFIISIGSDWIVLDGWMWDRLTIPNLLSAFTVSVLINSSVALLEETIFRGYLINGLRTVWGINITLVISSILFSIAHLLAYASKYPIKTMGLLLVLFTIFGLIFGWTYIKTGSLWLPMSIHFAWDFFENDVINLSGDSTNPHLVGAINILKGPFTTSGIDNAIFLDLFALILITFGMFIRLKRILYNIV